jgi:hypothetical protein
MTQSEVYQQGKSIPRNLEQTPSNDLGERRLRRISAWFMLFFLFQGQLGATWDTTVGAPGAIPPWLAWAIAATPLILIVWWVHRQMRYRRTLLAEKEVEGSIPL